MLQRLPVDWLFVLAIGIAGMVADFWSLRVPDLWYDETFTTELARQPIDVLWNTIWGREPNMELYFLLLHNWINLLQLLGIQPTEFMLRIPSALCGALGAIVVFKLVSRFFGGRFVGTVAALLYILNETQITAPQQARSYALELLLVCLLTYLFLEALDVSGRPSSSVRTRIVWWGAYVLIGSLVPYAHLFSGLVLLSQGLLFLALLVLPTAWKPAARRSLFWGLGSFLLIVLALIPAVLVSRNGGNNLWVTPARPVFVGHWLQILSNLDNLYM